MDISAIVPCYNEEKSLALFYQEFCRDIARIEGVSYELILVDDGSTDGTLREMKELAAKDSHVRYLSFSRNFGKESAIYAGLENARGDFCVPMDADLQDPPSLLPEMYGYVKNGEYDSVATRRVTRKGEPKIRSFFARQFYKLMSRISKVDLVDGARDYRLMNRKFVNAILSMQEYNRFSKGLFGWVGFRTKWLEYENVERVAGETKWSFFKLFLYAIDGIVAFSTFPLIISAVIGVLASTLSLGYLSYVLVKKILFGDPVAGWASSVSVDLFIGGVLLFFLGVIGEYMSKIYLEIKRRPIYITRETNIDHPVLSK